MKRIPMAESPIETQEQLAARQALAAARIAAATSPTARRAPGESIVYRIARLAERWEAAANSHGPGLAEMAGHPAIATMENACELGEQSVTMIEGAARLAIQPTAVSAVPDPTSRLLDLVDILEIVVKQCGNVRHFYGPHELMREAGDVRLWDSSIDVAARGRPSTYWPRNAGSARGEIRSNAELATRLAARGIVAWDDQNDQCVRVVRPAGWLTDEAAILDWTLGDRNGAGLGLVCRCCGTAEVTLSKLVAVKKQEVAAVGRRPQVSLDHVHAQCVPHWARLVARAAQLAGRNIVVIEDES
jgi:hypothetical protein